MRHNEHDPALPRFQLRLVSPGTSAHPDPDPGPDPNPNPNPNPDPNPNPNSVLNPNPTPTPVFNPTLSLILTSQYRAGLRAAVHQGRGGRCTTLTLAFTLTLTLVRVRVVG